MNPSLADATILMVDDTPANLHVLIDYLDDTGYNLLVATNGHLALERARSNTPDLILLDVLMPGLNGFETCRRLKADPVTANIPVIFMTALSEPHDKLEGFQAGGVDYITKPIEHAEVLARIKTHLTLRRLQLALASANEELERRVKARTAELEHAMEEIRALKNKLEAENVELRKELDFSTQYGSIVGASPALHAVVEKIEMVAPTEANVLIIGPSGTGKELVAHEIHKRSSRADGPLIKVNCACIPRELYESEFFGHVKGAFTGAVQSRLGRFAAADGGTLFLDEVGEIPLDLQSKLLRVLQEGTYERVGEEKTREVDVRIIAATNRDLAVESQEGRFRADLYYRLNVFPIAVPALVERLEDVPLLAAYFMERKAHRLGLPAAPALTARHIQQLQSYTWPGNIRELQNAVERAMIRSRLTGHLSFDDMGLLGEAHAAAAAPGAPHAAPVTSPAPGEVWSEEQMEAFVRENVRRALEKAEGRIRGPGGAAELLGVKPTTLASRLKSMGLG